MSGNLHARDITRFSSPIVPITPASTPAAPRRSKSTPKLQNEKTIYSLDAAHAADSSEGRTPSSSTWNLSNRAPRLRVSVFATKFRLFKARRTQSARDLLPQSFDVDKATEHEEVKESLPIRQGHPVTAVVPKDIVERRRAALERPAPLVGLGISGLPLMDGQSLLGRKRPTSSSMGREASSSSSSSSSGTGSPVTPNTNISYQYPDQPVKKADEGESRKSSEMTEEDLGDATSILGVLFGGEGNSDSQPWETNSILISSPLAEGASPTLKPTPMPPFLKRSKNNLPPKSMMKKSATMASVGRTPGMSKKEEEALDEYAQYLWCLV